MPRPDLETALDAMPRLVTQQGRTVGDVGSSGRKVLGMNKAITDGLVLMPPPFVAGLDVWSRTDGTPGSDTYEGAPNAALVPADQDFASALELQKVDGVQRLRWMGETPILPGLYLRVRARIKAISGNLPSVRIAGTPVGANGDIAGGVTTEGVEVALTSYGKVVTVEAIIGTGDRPGVDMVWGTDVVHGHFGLDLTGPDGGVVRIDDLEIEDVTAVFHRALMDWVDVRDYGAIGDGQTDDHAAFEAADAAAQAQGRRLLVSEGTYRIDQTLTVNVPVRFEGQLDMPSDARLQLLRSFDFPTYAAAFGDDDLALRKAIQALFNFSDHVVLDLKGRRVRLNAPIDVHAVVGNRDAFAQRRVITNGQVLVEEGGAWDTQTRTRQATYSPQDPRRLSGVSNVDAIQVGALVSGAGVGREVYVTEKNAGAGTLTLSQPLYDAEGTQDFTFTRYAYVFDFSGFSQLSKFEITNVEILCAGEASGLLLAPEGLTFRLADSVINSPRDRGISSPGRGCQGIFVERNQFLSNEMPLRAQDRSSIALNVNANDAKIRNNRVVMFAHFAILHGSGHIVLGNHFFQGDTEPQGVRQAGLVFTQPNVMSTVTGNYIDNCWIEWTNEHSAEPQFANQFSFGGMTVTGNIFTAIGVAPWFRCFVIKPHGPGHFVQGLNISGNVFRMINGNIERMDGVDTTFAGLDALRMRNITIESNAFNAVDQMTVNPVTLRHDQNSPASNWTIEAAGFLPFGGRARNVRGFVMEGPVTGENDAPRAAMPHFTTGAGANGTQVLMHWPEPVSGRAHVTLRVDNPN